MFQLELLARNLLTAADPAELPAVSMPTICPAPSGSFFLL
jgi:hypothetical protein